MQLSAICDSKRKRDPALRVDFEKEGVSPDLNELYTSDGILRMLESKVFETLHIVFPFVGASWIEYLAKSVINQMTRVYMMFSVLEHGLRWKYRREILSDDLLETLEWRFRNS